MCDFISWIKKDNQVIFLTADDIFRTKTGGELQKYCGNSRDLVGHGAVRHYYNFTGGVEKECTNFSTPDNFPPEIVAALKAGKFRGLGIPLGCLLKPALAEYEKVQRVARAKYEKAWQVAWAEYKKVEQAAQAECEKVQQGIFWDLFANPKNRKKCWR